MADLATQSRWRPTATHLVAGSLVIAGFLLAGISWWFFGLAALGTFGPGVLREMGWLHDKDEFQRRAAQRAGYHAFLAAGIVAFGLITFFRSGERDIDDAQELATFFLALLWFTWFLSSLLAYWGPQIAAARILYAFGLCWLAFTILSNTGSEWTGWSALLLHPLLALPFLVLAWLATRLPRVTGVLLLAVSLYFMSFFGWFRMQRVTEGVTCILFLGPLVSSGIALLSVTRDSDSFDDEKQR